MRLENASAMRCTPQPGARRLVAEAEAGQRRRHDVERVGRVTAVGGRIGERLDHLVELDDRPGPAVADHEGQGVLVRGPHVQEVDAEPVDLGAELREPVERGFSGPPVVVVGPVPAQLLRVRERDPLRPVVDRLGLGPARAAQALGQVVQLGLRYVDGERRDVGGHRCGQSSWGAVAARLRILVDHVGVGQRRRVAEVATLGHVAEQPAHDLARAGLGQVVGEDDRLGPGDRADLLGHVARAAPRRAGRTSRCRP